MSITTTLANTRIGRSIRAYLRRRWWASARRRIETFESILQQAFRDGEAANGFSVVYLDHGWYVADFYRRRWRIVNQFRFHNAAVQWARKQPTFGQRTLERIKKGGA